MSLKPVVDQTPKRLQLYKRTWQSLQKIFAKDASQKDKAKIGKGRNQTPINWNYPNPKFIDDYDPETTMEEVSKEAIPLLKEQKRVCTFYCCCY